MVYNQLYFIDVEEAINLREQYFGDKIRPAILKLIENMLREVNPICQTYYMMYEIIVKENLTNCSIAFNENIQRHVRNHNLPVTNSEIAAVF